jgi:hypothetical protein
MSWNALRERLNALGLTPDAGSDTGTDRYIYRLQVKCGSALSGAMDFASHQRLARSDHNIMLRCLQSLNTPSTPRTQGGAL